MTNFIDDLTKGKTKDGFKLKVRITALWKQKNRKGREDAQLILVDEKNSRIEATIPSFCVNKHLPKLKEYSVVVLSKFSVEENSNTWKIIQHPYIINFTYSTNVEQCNDCSISLMGIEPAEFEPISSGQVDNQTCVDIVGKVIKYEDIANVSKDSTQPKLKLKIVLSDKENRVLNCTLWDKYAEQMSTHINSYKDNQVVVILQNFRVNFFNGWGVSNGLYGSKIHFDQKLHDFMNSSAIAGSGSQIHSITHVSTNKPASKETIYFDPTYKRSLIQIEQSLEEGSGVVVADVVDFEDTITWYYRACKSCARKVKEDGDKFYCNNCSKNISVPDIRYLIRVIVTDDGFNTLSFTLFDKSVKEFVGKSASALLDQNPETFPEDLNFFLNKEFLFKVDINSRNLNIKFKNTRSYPVKNMSNDVKLIEEFRSLLVTSAMVTESTNHEEESDDCVCSTDSTTPKKRAFESIDDDTEHSEKSHQQQPTKLKSVKVEKNDSRDNV